MSMNEREHALRRLLESHLFYITQRVNPSEMVAVLRDRSVISESDQQEIENYVLCPTRELKAVHLVDIVRRKGVKGMEVFLTILEFRYPHVYTHVTGQVARKAPKEWNRNSNMSLKMNVINDKMADLIKSLAEEANHYKGRLDALKKLVSDQTESMESLQVENEELHAQIAQLLHDEVEWKKNRSSLEGTNEEQRKENAALRKEVDDKEQKIIQLKHMADNLKIAVDKAEGERSIESKAVDHWKNAMKLSNKMVEENTKMQSARLEIQELNSKNDALSKRYGDLEKLFQETRAKKDQLESECSGLQNELHRIQNDETFIEGCRFYRRYKASFLNGQREKHSAMYDNILGRMLLDNISTADEIGQDEEPIPDTPRERRNNMKALKTDTLSLPSGIRKAISSPAFSSTVEDPFKDFKSMLRPGHESKQNGTDHGSSNATMKPFHLDCVEKSLHGFALAGTCKSRSASASASKDEVSMEASWLKRDVSLVGGNYSGIFVDSIDKVHSKSGRPGDCGLQAGDRILRIKWIEATNQNEKSVDFVGKTLEEIHNNIAMLTGQLRVTQMPNSKDYRTIQNQLKTRREGDLFCVAVKSSMLASERRLDQVRPDGVLLVRGSFYKGGAEWFCDTIDPLFGALKDGGPGIFPNLNTIGKSSTSSRPSLSDEPNDDTATKSPAKPQTKPKPNSLNKPKLFCYVKPFTACAKRPVIICNNFGSDRDELFETLVGSQLFSRCKMEKSSDSLAELVRRSQTNDVIHFEADPKSTETECMTKQSLLCQLKENRARHLLLDVPVECVRRLKDIGVHPIVILIQIDSAHNGIPCDELFKLKQLYCSWEYETLLVSKSETSDATKLCDIVKSAVEHIQKSRILWVECDGPTLPL